MAGEFGWLAKRTRVSPSTTYYGESMVTETSLFVVINKNIIFEIHILSPRKWFRKNKSVVIYMLLLLVDKFIQNLYFGLDKLHKVMFKNQNFSSSGMFLTSISALPILKYFVGT